MDAMENAPWAIFTENIFRKDAHLTQFDRIPKRKTIHNAEN